VTVAAAPPPLVTPCGASGPFDVLPALDEVTLTLARGERLVLLGANGAGKSTLLRLLHGVQRPTADGARRAFPLAPEGRRPIMALVHQRPFFLRLSVQRNLQVALWLAGVPRAERGQRIADALARVGLATLARRSAPALSGGQQQRLAIARALAVAPDVMLLDEPTANLDPSAKREIESLVHDIAADGTTLVISTHNLGQARRFATRIAYLDGGRLLACQPVEDFFAETTLPAAARDFLHGELPWAT